MKQLAIITIIYDYPNHFKPTFEDRLLNDFDKNDYFTLRFDSKIENISEESYYFKFTYYRIYKIVDFIKKEILDKYKYFVLLDATDVGYVGFIDNIEDIMNHYQTKILFGAERNLWPNTQFSHLYPNKKIPTPYKFLNAGVFCAEPKEYLEKLEIIQSRGLKGLCDQGNWQIEYLVNHGIEIDYMNLLVLNTFEAKEDVEIKNSNVIFNFNKPIFIHDNGGYNDTTIKLLEYFR